MDETVALDLQGIFLGEFPDTVHRGKRYFGMRDITLDCRGELHIHENSHWGYFITVITMSHDISDGIMGNQVIRPVIVESEAWIGSRSLLYNCTIGEGSVVAVGSVVASCEVKPGVIVAGNPARVVARWKNGRWNWKTSKWRILK